MVPGPHSCRGHSTSAAARSRAITSRLWRQAKKAAVGRHHRTDVGYFGKGPTPSRPPSAPCGVPGKRRWPPGGSRLHCGCQAEDERARAGPRRLQEMASRPRGPIFPRPVGPAGDPRSARRVRRRMDALIDR